MQDDIQDLNDVKSFEVDQQNIIHDNYDIYNPDIEEINVEEKQIQNDNISNSIFDDESIFTKINDEQKGGNLINKEIYGDLGIIRINPFPFSYYFISNRQPVPNSYLPHIEALKIPKKWNNVWISQDPNSDIQVQSINSRGIKKFIFNKTCTKQMEKQKFLKLYSVLLNISKIDEILLLHQKLPYDNKYHVISTIISIVRKVHVQLGTEKNNGLVFLKHNNIIIDKDVIQFNIIRKCKIVSYSLSDKHISQHIMYLRKLPGSFIFQYVDGNDKIIRQVTIHDINDYLHLFLNGHSINDFRSYNVNYLFIETLVDQVKKYNFEDNTQYTSKILTDTLLIVSEKLKNNDAISKKIFIINFTIQLFYKNPKELANLKNNNVNNILLNIFQLYNTLYIEKS